MFCFKIPKQSAYTPSVAGGKAVPWRDRKGKAILAWKNKTSDRSWCSRCISLRNGWWLGLDRGTVTISLPHSCLIPQLAARLPSVGACGTWSITYPSSPETPSPFSPPVVQEKACGVVLIWCCLSLSPSCNYSDTGGQRSDNRARESEWEWKKMQHPSTHWPTATFARTHTHSLAQFFRVYAPSSHTHKPVTNFFQTRQRDFRPWACGGFPRALKKNINFPHVPRKQRVNASPFPQRAWIKMCECRLGNSSKRKKKTAHPTGTRWAGRW